MAYTDLPLLVEWLQRPHVARWWRDRDEPPSRYGPCLDGRDPTQLWLITVDGHAIGMLQSYLFADEPEWSATLSPHIDTANAAGIDYLIGDEPLTGQGIGTAAIDIAANRLLQRPDVNSVIVDVNTANAASWRALQRADFTIVWTGELASGDPPDEGTQHLLVRR